MVRVIGIGDNVCDKYRHLDLMFPGGQALNVAVYSRMKGCTSAYLGVFGDDAVALHVIQTLQLLGVDTSHCRHVSGENGYAVIDVVDGDRVFVCSNKGGVLKTNPIVLEQKDLDYIAGFDWIHTSNNSYLDAELPKLAGLDRFVSYDFSTTWKEEARAKGICQWVDAGFLSCSGLDEAEVQEQLQKMVGWGCRIAVATMGSQGAMVWDGDSFYPAEALPVTVVDTLGAGDSFAAGFLMEYVQQIVFHSLTPGSTPYIDAMQRALAAAAALSAETCMRQGAFGYGTKLS